MKKFKIFSTYSEEEKWLSELSDSGWMLVKKRVFYTFRKRTQQQLVYGIDYRKFKDKADYQDYLNLFEDSGWKHMAGSRWSGEQYFSASPNQDNDISIFSDRESSVYRYKKKAINSIQGIVFLLCYLLASHTLGNFKLRMLIDPSRAFLTPGLWEKSGEVFWKAFFFELPVAIIFRFLPVLLIVGCIILMIIYSFWAIHGEKKERKLENER